MILPYFRQNGSKFQKKEYKNCERNNVDAIVHKTFEPQQLLGKRKIQKILLICYSTLGKLYNDTTHNSEQ